MLLVRTLIRRSFRKFMMKCKKFPWKPMVLIIERNRLHTISYAFSISKATNVVDWWDTKLSQILISMLISWS